MPVCLPWSLEGLQSDHGLCQGRDGWFRQKCLIGLVEGLLSCCMWFLHFIVSCVQFLYRDWKKLCFYIICSSGLGLQKGSSWLGFKSLPKARSFCCRDVCQSSSENSFSLFQYILLCEYFQEYLRWKNKFNVPSRLFSVLVDFSVEALVNTSAVFFLTHKIS